MIQLVWKKRMIIKKERGLPFIFRYVEIDVNLSYRQHKPFQVPLSGRAWAIQNNSRTSLMRSRIRPGIGLLSPSRCTSNKCPRKHRICTQSVIYLKMMADLQFVREFCIQPVNSCIQLPDFSYWQDCIAKSTVAFHVCPVHLCIYCCTDRVEYQQIILESH